MERPKDAPVSRLQLDETLHQDSHQGPPRPDALLAYDRRRGAREGFDPAEPGFRGWSQQKAEMYARTQRADWAAFLEEKGFRLT